MSIYFSQSLKIICVFGASLLPIPCHFYDFQT